MASNFRITVIHTMRHFHSVTQFCSLPLKIQVVFGREISVAVFSDKDGLPAAPVELSDELPVFFSEFMRQPWKSSLFYYNVSTCTIFHWLLHSLVRPDQKDGCQRTRNISPQQSWSQPCEEERATLWWSSDHHSGDYRCSRSKPLGRGWYLNFFVQGG